MLYITIHFPHASYSINGRDLDTVDTDRMAFLAGQANPGVGSLYAATWSVTFQCGPGARPGFYWPAGVPRVATIEAFQAAYRPQGYEVCDSPDYESGVEMIALYALDGDPRQAA